MKQERPTCTSSISDDNNSPWERLFAPKEKIDQAMADTPTTVLSKRLKQVDLFSKIAEAIDSQRNGFVSAGGGMFDMKDPVFFEQRRLDARTYASIHAA